MKEAVTKVIQMPTQEHFHWTFQKLLERYKWTVAGGDYFEGDYSFHVPIWKKSGNLFNDPCIYIYIYIYICVCVCVYVCVCVCVWYWPMVIFLKVKSNKPLNPYLNLPVLVGLLRSSIFVLKIRPYIFKKKTRFKITRPTSIFIKLCF